jgi:hypothetical protein
MPRFFVACVASAAVLALLPSTASARFDVPGSSARVLARVVADEDTAKDAAAVAPAKSGGTIDGVVTAIDYRSNTMSVTAGARKVDVTILPSTNIQGPSNGFRTIADIQKGSHVRVLLSQRAGLYMAQIITLR